MLRSQLAFDRPWRDLAEVAELAAGLVTRYRTERAQMLADFEKRADAARERIRRRPGFEMLTPEQALHILRPIAIAIAIAIPPTPADAVAPSLADLSTLIPAKLAEAEEAANARLDAELEETTEQPVQVVRLALKGRELTTEDDIRLLLEEIETELAELVQRGVRVRLG